jgi:prepilin-type N-terminal cleavage/methylation domain-containing protein
MAMRSIRTGRPRGQEGITLIELLVSMIILAIISTMIVIGWANLQRASANVLSTNHARADLRGAMSRISTEVRAAQPLTFPTPMATASPVQLLTVASPYRVQFYSAFNADDANTDGTGVAAMRLTQISLDTSTVPPSPWNQLCRTLYWQRDSNHDGTITTTDRKIILARNVANSRLSTPVFSYGYRVAEDDDVEWTDNAGGTLDLTTVVAVTVRLIIDKKMAGTPNYVDLTTTVRLRNAVSESD